MYNTGLSKSMVHKTIKMLIKGQIMFIFGTIKGKFQDYKIYTINRKNLLNYLKASPQKELGLVHKASPQSYSTERLVEEDSLEEDTLEQDKKEEPADAGGSYTFRDTLVVDKYQPVADAPAGLSSYQGATPPPVKPIQFGSTVPLRSANDQPDVWDMLDAIPTISQTEMATALDYRTAHANRFNVNV